MAKWEHTEDPGPKPHFSVQPTRVCDHFAVALSIATVCGMAGGVGVAGGWGCSSSDRLLVDCIVLGSREEIGLGLEILKLLRFMLTAAKVSTNHKNE